MAELIEVKPYLGNDGATGECARWDAEPTPQQAEKFVSNEWAVGQTYMPLGWKESEESAPFISLGAFLLVAGIVVCITILCIVVFGG
jgi:hypothetical protein